MSSNFKTILSKHKESQGATDEAPPPSPAPVEEPQEDVKRPTPSALPNNPDNSKKRGRPKGKRTDKAFVQAPAWIRRETHKAVKMALLAEDKGQEFSELVETLLTKWLKTKT